MNDLITDFENFRDGHARLDDPRTIEADKKHAQQVVKSFINRKMAYKELEHYRDKKVFLGDHPIFDFKKYADKVRGQSALFLQKQINSLSANITRNRQNMERSTNVEDKMKYEAKLLDYQRKKELVISLLNER